MADGSIIFDTKLDTTGIVKGLSSLASGTLKVAAAGLAALGAYAISVGSDFEAGMSQVSATMGSAAHATVEYAGQSMEAIEAISKEASRLGAETAFSATQAAEGFNILAQSGLDAAEQIGTMSHVLDLAAAGSLSLEEAASFTTGTIKGFRDSFDNAQYYVDMMAKGATLANTDVRGLGEAMADSAATASTYGQNAEETTLALLRLAEQEVTGSTAATALSAAMKNLYAPTDQARAVMQALGVSAFDPVTGKARDFNTVVDELNAALAGYSDEQRIAYEQTIFGIQGFDAFNKISVTSTETVEEFRAGLRTASDAMDGAGSAAEQAATKLDNLKGDVTILKSAADGFGKSIYDNMQQPLRTFVQEATGIMNDLHQAVEEGGLSGLGGAVGKALSRAINMVAQYAPGLVKAAVDLVRSFVNGIADAAPQLASVAVEIGTTLLSGLYTIEADLIRLGAELIISLCNAIAENIGQLSSAVLSGMELIYSTAIEYLPQIVDAGIQLISSLAQGMIEVAPQLIESAIYLITELANSVIESAGAFIDAAAGIIDALVAALPQVISALLSALPGLIDAIVSGITTLAPKIVTCGVNLLTSLVKGMPQIIQSIVAKLPEIISSIVGGLLSMLPLIVDCGVQLLVALVQELPDIIYQIVAVLPQIISSIVQTLVGMTGQIIACGIQLLTSLVAALPQIITTIVAVLPSIVMAIVSALIDMIPQIIQCGIDLLTSLITVLPDIISAIVAAMPTIIAAVINALVSNIGMIVECGILLFTSLITALPQIISTIIASIPQIIRSIVHAIVGARGQIVEAGSNLLSGLADGIGNAIGNVVARARAAAARVASAVKSYFGIASPSKLFKNEIGRNLMLGLAGGIDDAKYAAINAAEGAAEDIADVDFDPKPDFDLNSDHFTKRLRLSADIDYAALIATASSAVNSLRRNTGSSIAGGYYGSADLSSKIDRLQACLETISDKIKIPNAIDATLNVDGKLFSRELVPYIEKELDWRNE